MGSKRWMKPSFLVLLLITAACVSPATAQTPRVAATQDSAPASAVKLPVTRPGSYIAGTRPLVAPPPAGLPELVLPPAFPMNQSAIPAPAAARPGPAVAKVANKGELAPDGRLAIPAGIADAVFREPEVAGTRKSKVDAANDASANDAEPSARRKPSTVFLSRDALQKTRDKCQVQLKSTETLKFGTYGGAKSVRLTVVGGRSCVKAISASHDWLSVSDLGPNDDVTVTVSDNEEPAIRDGTIVIANTGSSVHIKVTQEANTSGFRRIEL